MSLEFSYLHLSDLHFEAGPPGGEGWQARAFESCRRYLPVYSEAFFASTMCQWELNLSLSLSRDRDRDHSRGLVVPVRIDQAAIPFEHSLLQYLDAQRPDLWPCLHRDLGVQPTSEREQPALVQGIEAIQDAPALSRLHFIHDYLLPDNFTGRVAERGRLTALLQGRPDPLTGKQARVTTLRAVGGMGKSCLARKVAAELHGAGAYRDLVWFSFYEARSEDPARFFQLLLDALGVSCEEQPLSRLRDALHRRLEQVPAFLVLDGLDVIQHTRDPDGPRYGRLVEEHRDVQRLLAHLCNQERSAALVTSRVTLRELEGVSGYLELPLEILPLADAVEFLHRLGVAGDEQELRQCAEPFGSHPLTLKAAGHWLADRRIPAGRVGELIGDPALFRASPEGEKVARIVATYREELTPEQAHFLRLLSIHPRAVDQRHFGALVEGYGERVRDADWVRRELVFPWRKRD